jgi:hypothetical protein
VCLLFLLQCKIPHATCSHTHAHTTLHTINIGCVGQTTSTQLIRRQKTVQNQKQAQCIVRSVCINLGRPHHTKKQKQTLPKQKLQQLLQPRPHTPVVTTNKTCTPQRMLNLTAPTNKHPTYSSSHPMQHTPHGLLIPTQTEKQPKQQNKPHPTPKHGIGNTGRPHPHKEQTSIN